jgi:hypothetical protein
VSFTEANLVPNAGLLPAAALAQRIGLGDLIDQRVRLAVEGANSGAKALTVVGSMLAGGDRNLDARRICSRSLFRSKAIPSVTEEGMATDDTDPS